MRVLYTFFFPRVCVCVCVCLFKKTVVNLPPRHVHPYFILFAGMSLHHHHGLLLLFFLFFLFTKGTCMHRNKKQKKKNIQSCASWTSAQPVMSTEFRTLPRRHPLAPTPPPPPLPLAPLSPPTPIFNSFILFVERRPPPLS